MVGIKTNSLDYLRGEKEIDKDKVRILKVKTMPKEKKCWGDLNAKTV